jgi:hypothetical protein
MIMIKQRITAMFVIIITMPILISLLIMPWYDYNRFIQIPYWVMFSSCYLTKEWLDVSSMCSTHNIDSLGDWTISQWNWNLERYKNQPSNRPIPELQAEAFSYDTLRLKSNEFTVPVVIRGLFHNSTAVEKWNAEYFQRRYGDELLVAVTDGNRENASRKQHSKVESEDTFDDTGNGIQRQKQVFKMNLKTALHRMQQGETFFQSNIDSLFHKHAELLDDLEFQHRIKSWAYSPYNPVAPQMLLDYGIQSDEPFLSQTDVFQASYYSNFFIQVHGIKSWRFIDPRYSVHLRPRLNDFVSSAKTEMKPDIVPMMHVVLQPGDCLFNPPYIWHQSINDEGWNIGVATREFHPLWITRMNFLFHALTELRSNPNGAWERRRRRRRTVSFPFLSFIMSYLTEYFHGPIPHSLLMANVDVHGVNEFNNVFQSKSA